MSVSRKLTLWASLTGILIAALYGQFLHNPIVFDDLYFFMMGNDGHSSVEQFLKLSPFDLRALPYASLAWNAELFGFDLLPFRVENLLLHWFVVIALALFVLRLYRTVLPVFGTPLLNPDKTTSHSTKSASGQVAGYLPHAGEGANESLRERHVDENTGMTTAVLAVVLLFALHPISVYAAGYLVQRSTVLATLFGVLSLWAYLKGSSGNGKLWLWSSVALYFMATHSKEHLVMLPFVIVAMTVLVHDDWKKQLRRNWPVFAGYVAIALLTVAQIKGVLGHPYEISSGEMLDGAATQNAMLDSMLTQCWLFFKYGVLWLLPNPAWMSVDMREPLAQGLFSVYGLALLAYLSYGVFALRLLFKRGTAGLIGFALLFPWLMFATEFSTVRIQEIFVLYRSYVWALGGVVLLPMALMRLNARLTIAVSVLVASTMFMVSMERLQTFSHPILLWEDAEKLVKDRQNLPGASRIYYNLGTEWLKVDSFEHAFVALNTAIRLNPEMSAGYGNLGSVYLKTGNNQQAIGAYSRAIELDQRQHAQPNYKHYMGRASAYEAAGKPLQAAIDYRVVCLLANKGCDKAGGLR